MSEILECSGGIWTYRHNGFVPPKSVLETAAKENGLDIDLELNDRAREQDKELLKHIDEYAREAFGEKKDTTLEEALLEAGGARKTFNPDWNSNGFRRSIRADYDLVDTLFHKPTLKERLAFIVQTIKAALA